MIDTRKFSIPLGLLEAKHVVPPWNLSWIIT